MPTSSGPGGELSLRHLPDVSDTSFSFQIPATTRGDYLLADDDGDFFKGAEDILATPAAPSRFALDPLTLSQLTPRPSVGQSSSLPSPPQNQPCRSTLNEDDRMTIRPPLEVQRLVTQVRSKPRPKLVTRTSQLFNNEGSSPTKRIETLRVEVNSLTDDLGGVQEPIKSSARKLQLRKQPAQGKESELHGQQREKVRANAKRTVISGGITKSRKQREPTKSIVVRDAAAAFIEHAIPSGRLAPTKILDGADGTNPDTSVGSITLGGVAERLLMYSQNLVTSYGAINGRLSSNPGYPPDLLPSYTMKGTSECTASTAPTADNDRPLTVSQLSPQKISSVAPVPPPIPEIAPMSPLRRPSKRPVSDPSDVSLSRKKGKFAPPIATTFDSKVSLIPSAEQPPAGKSIGRIASASRSKSNVINEKTKARSKAKAHALMKPVNKAGNSHSERDKEDPSESTSAVNSMQSNELRSLQEQQANRGKIKSAGGSSLPLQPATLSNGPSSSTNAKHVMSATIPNEFKFSSDARLEARKSEFEKEKPTTSTQRPRRHHQHHHNAYSIPDFKALHAAHEAELALRKENILPVVPVPIKFETDQRVKERQKYDERMREKERQLEREMEQRRKEEQEQEEREVRELRKKAIPRAHEVPDWYRDAPRKKVKS